MPGRRLAGRIVDSRPFGGTCGLRGCDPKKILAGAAEIVDWQRRMRGNGVKGDAAIDWPELIRFKRTFTDPFPKAREDGFQQAGIATFHGVAKFTGANSLQVDGAALEGRRVLIATGAWPAKLNISGERHLTRSDQFMELEELPERIVFVGGGYIAFEFSHIAARAGSQVAILHQGKRPLEKFDPDLVARLVKRTREIGIDVRTETRVTSVEGESGRYTVLAQAGPSGQSFEADLVVHAAGRSPEIAELNLSAAAVEFDARGVKGTSICKAFPIRPFTPPATRPIAGAGRSPPPPNTKDGSPPATCWKATGTKSTLPAWRAWCIRSRRWPEWGCTRKTRYAGD